MMTPRREWLSRLARKQEQERKEKRSNGGRDSESGGLSEADKKMDKVHGDHVHQNPGRHLKDGVSDDDK
jgi:hypothetical protein